MTGPIDLVERNDPSRSQMRGQPTEHSRRLGLELQHVPSHDSVERARKGQLRRVALLKSDIAARTVSSTAARSTDRVGRPVDSDDRPALPDKLRGKKRNITTPSADVKHPHPGPDSSVDEHLPGDRLEQLRIEREPSKLRLRVTEHVLAAADIVRTITPIGHPCSFVEPASRAPDERRARVPG